MPEVSTAVDNKKRLAIICPEFLGYEKRLRDASVQLGYEVVSIDERIDNSARSKIATRLGLLNALPLLKKAHVKRIQSLLVEFSPDKILIINPETLGSEDFLEIRKKFPSARLLLYMWDSSSKKTVNAEMSRAVHAAYSFDPKDCESIEGWKHLPLFHCHNEFTLHSTEKRPYDMSFVGTARVHRLHILAKLERTLCKKNQTSLFFLYCASPLHYIGYKALAVWFGFKGIVSKEKMSYEKYLDILEESMCVVDIEQKRQIGLTIRTIESAFSGSAVLTTNRSVLLYDFYQYCPIAVWSPEQNLPPSFSASNGDKLKKLFFQYSVSNWLSNILDERQQSYSIDENYSACDKG